MEGGRDSLKGRDLSVGSFRLEVILVCKGGETVEDSNCKYKVRETIGLK